MAKSILDARIYLAEVDLSCYSNAAAINLKTDVLDCTAFCDAYKDKLAGMTDVIVDVAGYFSADSTTGNPDKKLFDQLALHNAVLTICPEAAVLDTVAYFFRPTLTQYNPIEGKVGEVAAFKLHGEGAAPMVKGKVLAAQDARTITGYSTKINLGAYTATQTMYAALHVFAKSGTPTLDVTICIADAITTATIHTAGSGYSIGQDLTLVQSGAEGATFNIDSIDGGGGVTGITNLTSGSGYAVANGLSTTGGAGTGAKLNVTAIGDSAALITFTQKTDVGFEWKTDAGPITNTNFKALWTIGGGTPSITFAVVAGIV